jgi:uncharacterized protein (DUF1684 family)
MNIKIFFGAKIVAAFCLFILLSDDLTAQKKSYKDSLLEYQQNYVATHEVVGNNDKKYLSFYNVDKAYRVDAVFKRQIDKQGFNMNTSSGQKSKYFKYGLLTFKIHDTLQHLYIYQSQELMKDQKLKDYLFVPFGDATSGFESYGGGRYLDFKISDIKNNQLVIDFNKAYNPYCAYTTGYNCPLPPIENIVKIAILAGEKNYGKKIH